MADDSSRRAEEVIAGSDADLIGEPATLLEQWANAFDDAWTSAALDLLPDMPQRIDAHTHLGVDSDGSQLAPEELLVELDQCHVDVALVAPLHHEEGYAQANRELLGWCRKSEGRFLPLCRFDPSQDEVARAVRESFEAGGVGIKLHPRAERFSMGDPGVLEISRVAHEYSAPILIHAGRGMPALGRQVLELAHEFTQATFILAHAAVSDLAWVAHDARDVPNVVFDTAWWNPVDIAALLSLVPPSRVLFGTDPPYGPVSFGLQLTARLARAVGYDDGCMRALFGGNIGRILEQRAPSLVATGECRPEEIDTAMQASEALFPHAWCFRRCAAYLTGAMATAVGGGDADEQLELAEHALDVPEDAEERREAVILRSAVRVTRQAFAAGEPRLGVHLAVMTLTHAMTPQFGIAAPHRRDDGPASGPPRR